MHELLMIEVCWLEHGATARLISWHMPHGTVVADALQQLFPNQDIEEQHLSCFGKPCTLTTPLSQGFRLEITGPLVIDPKVARQLRATKS